MVVKGDNHSEILNFLRRATRSINGVAYVGEGSPTTSARSDPTPALYFRQLGADYRAPASRHYMITINWLCVIETENEDEMHLTLHRFKAWLNANQQMVARPNEPYAIRALIDGTSGPYVETSSRKTTTPKFRMEVRFHTLHKERFIDELLLALTIETELASIDSLLRMAGTALLGALLDVGTISGQLFTAGGTATAGEIMSASSSGLWLASTGTVSVTEIVAGASGALIDDLTWNAGHDFAAESGGSIPGINGTEVALTNQGGRSFTKLSTAGFLERAIGSVRADLALKPDGGTYQFVGSADPAFDYPGDQDIHWRVVAVDDSNPAGGFSTWAQRRNGSGLSIERIGSSNSTGQPQLTVFPGSTSLVSYTGGVPDPSQNGEPLLLDFRQVAATGDIELSVNGFHSSSANRLTTPFPSLADMTMSCLNATVGGAIFIGVRHNQPYTNADHEVAWSNAVPAPRPGNLMTSVMSASPAGAAMGSGLANGFSVAFWARRNVAGNAEFCGASSASSWQNNWGFDLFGRTGSTFWVNRWNGTTRVTGDDPAQDVWVHHVGTYDGDRLEIWQDGVFKAGLDGVSITNSNDAGNMSIRGISGFSSNGADVDECGFWAGKALDSTEIALLATGVPVSDVSGCTHRWATSDGVDQVGNLDLT